MSRLIVHGPARPLAGQGRLVGDKSISHRALILGALAGGSTRIHNLSPCADVARTVECLTRLGVDIVPVGATAGGSPAATRGPAPPGVVVRGRGVAGLGGPPVMLDCGDSGTTLRLLAGVLAGQDRAFTLVAAPGLARRPMARVVSPLAAMGAAVAAEDGHAPVTGQGGGLRAVDVALDHASAQVGSAVLLAGLNAAGTTCVRYPAPVRDHTERLLAAMGAPVRWDGAASELDGPVGALAPLGDRPGASVFDVPADPSAAAFLLAAAAVVDGSDVRLAGVGTNPGRTGFFEILARMGLALELAPGASRANEPTAEVRATTRPLSAATVDGTLIARSIDELPLVAVAATRAAGRTVVADAGELRVKECDRITAIVEGLARLGARVEARPDGFVVDGPCDLAGAEVDGHGDHRIVMALAVAGLVARGTTVVHGAERIADSFPGFVDALAALGADLRVEA